ncbi:MAG: dienelactone hydrolase family protein [Xanthobacteraceae bacterium]
MDQRVYDLYDSFTHGQIHRREFLDRLAVVAGSTAAATTMLSLLQNDYAKAATIAENDPRLVAERATFDSPSGKISGYLVRPKEKGKRPAILVIHENRGLNPHIEDVARRLATEGYLAYAIDLLSPLGGTPKDEEEARKMFGKVDRKDTSALVAAVAFLDKHPESTGKVGAVGFCAGGEMVNQLATTAPELDAVVAYYGRAPAPEQVQNIKASLLLQYAENDAGVNGTRAAYEEALKANKKKYAMHQYPGTQHAFNNDTGDRYNKEQAEIAWKRTLDFFKANLS